MTFNIDQMRKDVEELRAKGFQTPPTDEFVISREVELQSPYRNTPKKKIRAPRPYDPEMDRLDKLKAAAGDK